MKIAIMFFLNFTAQRNRLIGVFNAIRPTDNWDIHILQSERELREMLSAKDSPPDGIITTTPRENETRHCLARTTIPFVAIGMDPALQRARKCDSVFINNDNHSAARSAARYLVNLGSFRTFAYIPHSLSRPWSILRGNVFAEEIKTLKRTCETYRCHPDREKDLAGLSAFVSRLKKPAAVFTANDERALDVLRIAKSHRIRIPEQLAVLGVDDDEFLCEHSSPPLSSVKTNTTQEGFAAVQSLRKLMKRKRGRRHPNVIVPIIGITERSSTKPVAPAVHLIDRAQTYIHDEFRNAITPKDVADHLGISKALLFLRFRQFSEKTVSETINEMRLAETKRLLRTTNRKVGSIFLSVGFKSSIHATRLFKKTIGMTPLEFRAANQCE